MMASQLSVVAAVCSSIQDQQLQEQCLDTDDDKRLCLTDVKKQQLTSWLRSVVHTFSAH